MVLADKIASAIDNLLGWLQKSEGNRSIRYLHKQIYRLRKAKGYAQSYIEADEKLDTSLTEKERKAVIRKKEYFKEKFREID